MTDLYARYPSLEGRRVLITGGGSGIGASLVVHFAGQGAYVGFLDLDAEASERLLATLPSGAKVWFRLADLRDIKATQAAIDELSTELGGAPTVLVNNAGRDDRHATDTVTPDYWDDRIATNLRHQFFCIQAVHAKMAEAGGGSIINMSSNAYLLGAPGMPVYLAAKSAVIGMTRGLARVFGPDRIRVNAILPGWVMTDRQLSLWMDEQGERRRREGQCIPDRVQPADIARMALWLAADDSALVTAREFIIDGGWL